MNARGLEQFESPLDAYLDGLMSAEQRSAFERRLAEDEALRAELALQVELDKALVRRFDPPSAERAVAAVSAAAAKPSRRVLRLSSVNLLAAAALVALAGLGLWHWFYQDLTPDQAYWQKHNYPLVTVYRYEAASGFKPDWICKNDQQFAGSIWARLGQPLVLAAVPPSVKPVGLGYANSLSEDTMVLLATVKGDRVVVFIDRASHEPTEPISLLDRFRTGLRSFRRKIGDLVLIEVTPHDAPAVLDLLKVPEQGEDWLREGARELGINVG